MLQMRTDGVSAIQGPRDDKRRERDMRVRGLQLGRTSSTLSSWHSPRVREEKGPEVSHTASSKRPLLFGQR